jgi:hypothetical protein
VGKGLDDEIFGEVTDNLIFQYTFARREKDEQIMIDLYYEFISSFFLYMQIE